MDSLPAGSTVRRLFCSPNPFNETVNRASVELVAMDRDY